MNAAAHPTSLADLALEIRHPADMSALRWLHDRVSAAERAALGVGREDAGLFIKDEAGHIVAGLVCWLRGHDAYLHMLWVDAPWRRHGLAATLMRTGEALAAKRGCSRALVNTMQFQAPDFYPRLGYVPMGVMVDFTGGHDRLYFRKTPLAEKAPAPDLPPGLRLEVSAPPAHEDVRLVEEGLDAHWLLHIDRLYTELTVMARDSAGDPLGGVMGVVDNGYFTVVDCWVEPAQRRQGLGRRLLAAAEATAAEAGCRWATACPMAFQHPGFFQAQGYMPALHIEDYLLGHGRYWLRRPLGTTP